MTAAGDRPSRLRGPVTLVAALIMLPVEPVAGSESTAAPIERGGAATHRICTLERVLDGDSLGLICGGRPLEVRLYCIDAPEQDQEPWGDRAREHLQGIATRRLEVRAIEVDRFGRTVAEVSTATGPRRSLNLEQVRQGQAAVYSRYCRDARFFGAERRARDAALGIWAAPGAHQTPWAYRHRFRPRSGRSSATDASRSNGSR